MLLTERPQEPEGAVHAWHSQTLSLLPQGIALGKGSLCHWCLSTAAPGVPTRALTAQCQHGQFHPHVLGFIKLNAACLVVQVVSLTAVLEIHSN